MRVTLDWLGVATFRLTVGERVIFLDAYMDRVPAAPPVGLSAADVAPIRRMLAARTPGARLVDMEYVAGYPILR